MRVQPHTLGQAVRGIESKKGWEEEVITRSHVKEAETRIRGHGAGEATATVNISIGPDVGGESWGDTGGGRVDWVSEARCVNVRDCQSERTRAFSQRPRHVATE